MKVYLGESGLGESWQGPFPKTVKCHKCGGRARVMFVAAEDITGKEYIFNLHRNGENGYWLHDACAVAVYLCKKCFEPNAVINQA